MSVVSDGGYGTGINPTGYHFPFIREVPEAKRLFADMYLGYSVKHAIPFRVANIVGFTQPPISSSSFSDSETPFRAEINIVDANNSLVFNSQTANKYRYTPWSDRLAIHEWISEDVVCRVVQHLGQNDLEDVLVYPDSQTLTGAVLDERVCELWPGRITKLIVNGVDIYGDVELEGGYNFTNILSDTDNVYGHARVNSVFVAASPASGLGRPPSCGDQTIENLTIKTINQIGPDERGSFALSSDDCMQLRRNGVTTSTGLGAEYSGIDREIVFTAENSIKIVDMCLPCCSCDDFVNTYRGLKRIYNKYQTLGSVAQSTSASHSSNVARWLTQKTLRESWPVNLSAIPYRLKDTSCLKVTLAIRNSHEDCRGEFSADLHFTVPATASLLKGYINPESVFIYDFDGYTARNYTLEGSWPDYTARWPSINSSRHAKIKFEMTFLREPLVTWDGYVSLMNGPAAMSPIPPVDKTVSYKELTNNVASLTTATNHTFVPGELVVVSDVDELFDGAYAVLATPTSTTFTYVLIGVDVCYVAATGKVASITDIVAGTPDGSGLGQHVMSGRFFISPSNDYLIVGSVFWLDTTASVNKGSKVERLLESVNITVASAALVPGSTGTMGSWSWEILENPTSAAVKPFSIRLKYDSTSTWTNALFKSSREPLRTIYTGRLYADTLINPSFTSRVNEGDYITIDVDAKLNNATLLNGILSKTTLLKVM